MFSFLIKKLNGWILKSQTGAEDHPDGRLTQARLSSSLSENLQKLRELFGNSSDLVVRRFLFGSDQRHSAALVYIDGLINNQVINNSIIKPLMYGAKMANPPEGSKHPLPERVRDSMLAVGEVKDIGGVDDAADGCLMGDALLLLDGFATGLLISAKGWEKRGITEPSTESVIRGPREGFTENLRTNTMLLRRKIRSPSLRFESMTVGRKTRTPVCLVYLDGLASDQLLSTVRRRIERMDVDAVLESGYIEQYIEDAPYSLFSTVGYSEKPDVAAAKILEGRVAILIDGTPFVLTAPMLMVESFQTSEDYYIRPFFATMLRILRYISFFISIIGPATYVALTTYHQELVPTDLLVTMANSKEGTPFPAVLEAGIMMITFEILREAGLRLPRPVGQAISIVGALVMGEASVSAGLVGAPVVIVIAITAVSAFVVPSQADAGAVIRFAMLILAATLGGYGITLGLVFILVHLSSLKSFGFPYLSPLAPIEYSDLKDVIIRAPLWAMLTRPKRMADDRKRQKLTMPSVANITDDREQD